MDWFSSQLKTGFLAEAQKKAQEAAEKARELASQASVQARAIAEQATSQAKVLAERAAQETSQLQARLEKLAETSAAPPPATGAAGSSAAPAATDDPAELAKYGVTDALMAFVMGNLTYSTFSDTNLEALAASSPLGFAPGCSGPDARLSAWQERHALLALTRCEQLQHLRFALCPKRMTDTQFWMVYFSHCKQLLPPEAFGLPPAPGQASSSGAAGAGASTDSSASAARSAAAASTSQPASTKAAAGDSPAPSGAQQAAATNAGQDSGDAGQAGGDDMGLGDDLGLCDDELDGLVGDDELGEGEGEDDELGGLEELENDAELAAYLQEALEAGSDGGGEGGEGGEGDVEGLSDLGSGADDLDDYINQLDAELAASSTDVSPLKATPKKK